MKNREKSFIADFFQMESAGGITLMIAALLAMVVANSPLQPLYQLFLDIPVEIRIGNLEIAKPLLLWINDGLMTIFFFLVGLELKRELVEGELSDVRKIILPAVGAVGGMIVPALIYTLFNFNDPIAMKGWAIPAATDIAFALGILSLLGSRVPVSLKIFLTSVAIFDDIGAILIIALFYTAKLSIFSLLIVAGCIPVLQFFNKRGIESKSPYILVGIVMWVAMLKSGVHATLTGVILAMFIPLTSKTDPHHSPLKSIEHDLHSVVAFFVMPIFAFANSGIRLIGMSTEQILHNVPIGIALGLLIGKQIGVFGFSWVLIKLKFSTLPTGMNWGTLYGTATLCGIGFTMSLFIGSLAFEESGINLMFDERIGIILGSILSGVLGYAVLNSNLPKSARKRDSR
jgi:NhaA family Na+:H+ antiporter